MSPLDPGRWSDETIVITGGSQGIGLALATELAGRCRTLTLIARDTDRLRQAAGMVWVLSDHIAVVAVVVARRPPMCTDFSRSSIGV